MEYDILFNTTRLTQSSMVECLISAVKDPRLKEAEDESMALLDDIILAKRVEVELLRSSLLRVLHFGIRAEDGVVTLSGHVQSITEIEEAIRLARSVAGVSDVESEMDVISFKPAKD